MQSGKTQILPQNKGAVLKAVVIVNRVVRLILTRIRLRASDFGQVAKISFVQIEIRCGDSTRVISLYARVIQQSGFRTYLVEISSQRRLLLWRRAECIRPWTQAFKPALTDSSLAAKRRTEVLHEVFFSTKHPSPARRPAAAAAAAAVCVLSFV